MIAAHHSGPCYPTIWERLALFGRKNKAPKKPQKERGRTKGGRKPARPPHRGGTAGKKKGFFS